MNHQTAAILLDETFDNSYDGGRFSNFIRELFNGFDFSYNVLKNIKKEYKQYIDSYQVLGRYTDSNKKIIDVLVVKLNKESASRDRARTKQRNFVANYLGHADKDAALVAFYGDDPQDWRFSFVKMDYSFTNEGNIVTELTPAKRYSYLVGVNEPNHTCRSQFLNLIIEEDKNPSIAEIEEAFSIDNVTKEFFLMYKKYFLELKGSLDDIIDNNPDVREEFDEKSISTVDFSKKLLGQIVFIYFLQKKGWLGVGKDDKTGKFKQWGEGPKKFVSKLFNKEIVQYENFFNDILEPLFYEALAKEHDEDYYRLFNCKIPFLNGGLFEPINDYDWVNVKIPLENSIFEKILDTFNRFNFTVKEDEPLDKEVAVDPEMLGKVFENLLDVKDRKSKGAFYTPREIVHYMCQQSLINYLETNTDIPVTDIETFIQYGDFAQQLTINSNTDEKYIPASIKNNRDKIDNLLKNIKIVDPAVGSGAFPMGMMNEIVKVRSILSWLSKEEKRTYYDLKRETIENCLYGVDIDSSAVDIAKLRFWLSLVVDETDIKKIKPLPNLDHRIMCGNSLLEEFEGVKLFDEQLLEIIPETSDFELGLVNAEIEKLYTELGEIHTGKRKDNGRKKEIGTELKKLERKRKMILSRPKDETQQSTFDSVLENRRKESQRKLAELKRLQKAFFNEERRKWKKELAEDIDRIEWELVEETLKEQGNESAMQKLAQYKKNKSKPFFLWKLYFSEVFQRENPGFDVVIANPPYVGEKGHKEIFRDVANGEFGRKYYNAKMDIFYFFFHKSIDISKNTGTISFITTNYYITATGAKKLRLDFKNRTMVKKIVNFNELRIFDSAKGQHNMITILSKNQFGLMGKTCITKREGVANSNILNKILSWTDSETNYNLVKQDNLYEGKDNYIRISGVNILANSPKDQILNKMKMGGCLLGNICNINSGCDITISKITRKHLDKFSGDFKYGDGVFVLNPKEINELNLAKDEINIIKSFIKNSDIYPFKINFSKNKLIYLRWEDNINKYPCIKNHLNKFKDILVDQADRYNEDYPWFALHRPREKDIFESKQKILVPYRNRKNIFGYSEESVYSSRDVFFITKNDKNCDLKFLLSLLNSNLFYLWLYEKGKRKGEILELYHRPLSEIPIMKISFEKQIPFINLVDQILAITKDDDYLDNPSKQSQVKTLENQIDRLVYKLYDLTPEEIEIVEGFNKGK